VKTQEAHTSNLIFHVDMDAFYAAIEQVDNPNLAGRPVIIGADPKNGKGRGVVSTASYEARVFGIHSAMPISQAFRLCPHGVFLPVRGRRYKEISCHIMAIFDLFTPNTEAISLDEAYLDMTGMGRLSGTPLQIAERLKTRVREATGLTASVGIGPNKLIAKIASDLEKPDGLVYVKAESVQAFLAPLSVGRLWGIGKKTASRLADISVTTVGQLAEIPRETLIDLFGDIWGGSLWKLARGIDDSPVVTGREAKSVSNETTFFRDVTDPETHKQTLLALAEKVGYRTRKKGLQGKTVTLKVRFSDFTTYVRHLTLPDFTDFSENIYESSLSLYESVTLCQPVRLLGVGLTQLIASNSKQESLFSMDEKRSKISEAVDSLKHKYGERIITKGSAAEIYQKRHARKDEKTKRG
jgi:nucleotidyltransferase/DNA polymerase involved in DNA repair